MIDIVLISTYGRPDLFKQTVVSLKQNATDWGLCRLTTVFNGEHPDRFMYAMRDEYDTMIVCGNVGASAARNIGASSIPKYRRGDYVLFLDDDVWLAPEYDTTLIKMAEALPRHLISLYGHPFNQEEDRGHDLAKFPLLISSVCVFMPWSAWDEIGFWTEPGGPGASEDCEYCSRAKKLGYEFAVSNPHRLIHAGITSSKGEPIVGSDLLKEQNRKLEEFYGARVIYA